MSYAHKASLGVLGQAVFQAVIRGSRPLPFCCTSLFCGPRPSLLSRWMGKEEMRSCMGGLERHSPLLLAFQGPELTHTAIPTQEGPQKVGRSRVLRRKGIVSHLCRRHQPVSAAWYILPCKAGIKPQFYRWENWGSEGWDFLPKGMLLVSVRVRTSLTLPALHFYLSRLGLQSTWSPLLYKLSGRGLVLFFSRFPHVLCQINFFFTTPNTMNFFFQMGQANLYSYYPWFYITSPPSTPDTLSILKTNAIRW